MQKYYKINDRQGNSELTKEVFETLGDVYERLKQYHWDIPEVEKYTLVDLIETGHWELITLVSTEDIQKELSKIITGIESDRFTIENITQLISKLD